MKKEDTQKDTDFAVLKTMTDLLGKSGKSEDAIKERIALQKKRCKVILKRSQMQIENNV